MKAATLYGWGDRRLVSGAGGLIDTVMTGGEVGDDILHRIISPNRQNEVHPIADVRLKRGQQHRTGTIAEAGNADMSWWCKRRTHLAAEGTALPSYVEREFEDYLKCGRLEHGFLWVHCDTCHAEHLVAFSYKCRGFCPSCGARRMAESAALLVDEVIPEQPVRQWVLSFPYPLRFLFASRPALMGRVLGIVYRALATHLIRKAGFSRKTAQAGAVTLMQRAEPEYPFPHAVP